MARRSGEQRRTYGNAVLKRIADLGVPVALKDDVACFKTSHLAFAACQKVVAAAYAARDAVLEKVARLDDTRDGTLLELADAMPGAGLGTRSKPFGAYSPYSPSKVAGMPYAEESTAIDELLDALDAAKPPAPIAKLSARCRKENAAVGVALEGLTTPQARLVEARGERDAAIPEWDKRERRLRSAAKVALRDQPARLAALFAEPEAVQVAGGHAKRRAGKPAGTPAGAPAGDGQAAPALTTGAAKRPRKRAR
jgi:hypothetical protein